MGGVTCYVTSSSSSSKGQQQEGSSSDSSSAGVQPAASDAMTVLMLPDHFSLADSSTLLQVGPPNGSLLGQRLQRLQPAAAPTLASQQHADIPVMPINLGTGMLQSPKVADLQSLHTPVKANYG
jgi:hypothetical protein